MTGVGFMTGRDTKRYFTVNFANISLLVSIFYLHR